MRRWTGDFEQGALPEDVEEALRRRCRNIFINRSKLAENAAEQIAQVIVDEVSFAFVGRGHELSHNGRGRPIKGTSLLLSARIADILEQSGIRGKWRALSDDDEDAAVGIVAELEAVALTALQQAWTRPPNGAKARPARISEARKVLGKIEVR